MTLQYIEALKELGKGEATKILLPMELSRMLQNLPLGEMAKGASGAAKKAS